MNARVKADNLIDLVRNTNSKINIMNSQFINYNDMEEFLDDLTFLYWQTGMFSDQEIVDLYTEYNFIRRIDLATQSIKKIMSLSNKIKDIGKMAERNI